MPERLAGTVTCDACEGSGYCAEFCMPDGNRLQVKCVESKVNERLRDARKKVTEFVLSPKAEERKLAMRLRSEIKAIIDFATYTSQRCKWCDGRGWELRLMQTEAA